MSDTELLRLRDWIASAGLEAHSRLPPERELCTALGISRTQLRKALLVLEAEGVLERHVGRGTFLARPLKSRKPGGVTDIIRSLAECTGPQEAMLARLALEPELARMAALNASPLHLRTLRRLSKSMRAVPTWRAYEELDAAFHATIAEASGNPLLEELHKIMNGVRKVVVWRKLSTQQTAPQPTYHSFDEHDAIGRRPGGPGRRRGAQADAAPPGIDNPGDVIQLRRDAAPPGR